MICCYSNENQNIIDVTRYLIINQNNRVMGKTKLFRDSMWPPTLEQVKIYFSQKGMNEKEAEHFFELYQMRQWRTKKGSLITRWKNAAHNWIFSAIKAQPKLFD